MSKVGENELLFLEVDDIESILIYKALRRTITERKQFYSTNKFNIDSIALHNFRFIFRFEKKDIHHLHKALQLPDRFETCDQHVVDGTEGLCMLLLRFAYPNRLKELQDKFYRHHTSISKLLNVIIDFIFKKWGQLLLNFIENKWFSHDFQKELAVVVHSKGAPLKNCIGFIDGTARPICRPQINQKEVYSGHKRVHCMKFQNITLPNGIIIHMSMPYPGRRHDAFILKDTLILEQLNLYCSDFSIYGDEGYPLKKQLIRPYSNSSLSESQRNFNHNMSSVRQCVEWSFAKIVQQFAFVDFKKNLKLYLQPVGKYYIVATLLTNAHTCLYGSATSTYFNVESPSLREYFQ